MGRLTKMRVFITSIIVVGALLSLCIIIGELEEGWEKIELAFMAQFNPYSNELSLEFHEFITP